MESASFHVWGFFGFCMCDVMPQRVDILSLSCNVEIGVGFTG